MTFVNKGKVAKNTLLLYVRMLVLMGVSLYTSRVILSTLGVDDYGLYTLIGGVIALFSFVSGSLVDAVQRFLNVAIGQGDRNGYDQAYSTGVNLIMLLSVAFIIIGETIGLWFVNTQLVIPKGRESAAIWVYQISLITMMVQLFRIPDNARVIAHEEMSFYAYLSILEALLKLAIVFLLQRELEDKLILYVELYLLATMFVNCVYHGFCRFKLSRCRYRMKWNAGLAKDMAVYSGWNILSNGIHVGTIQGENFILNHHYPISINAARGISAQIYNAANLFLTNFQTAFRPQLIKTYSSGNREEHFEFVNKSSKYSFCLMLAIVVPIVFNIESLLEIWLVDVPSGTREFCIFTLIAYLFDALGMPLYTSVSANGNIKGMHIGMTLVYLVQLIASWISLKNGASAYIVAIYAAIAHLLLLVIYIISAHKICGVVVETFLKEVIMSALGTTALAIVLPSVLIRWSNSVWMTLGICLIDVIWVCGISYMVGLNFEEKKKLRQMIRI